MTFRVIPPLPMTSAMLVQSDVPEPDVAGGEQAWNAATSYGLDAQVINLTTHRKFSSLQANNLNHPTPVWPETQNAWWYDIGTSNRWALFDLMRASATARNGPWSFTIAPGQRIDAIALRRLAATSVDVVMRSNGNVVFQASANLNRRVVRNAYDYCFAPFETQPNLTLYNLPPISGAQIQVTLNNAGAPASCGVCAVGRSVLMGDMLAEAESDTLDFSVIERDKQGVLTLTPGRSVPKLVSQIVCDKPLLKRVRDLRDRNAGMPLIWDGTSSDGDPYAEIVDVCGPYRRFTINLKQTLAVISLELEEI